MRANLPKYGLVVILSTFLTLDLLATYPKHLTPRAQQLLDQARLTHVTAYHELIRATLEPVTSDPARVKITADNLDHFLARERGAQVAYLNRIHHKNYRSIPAHFTTRILDRLAPYTSADSVPRPQFFYHRNILLAPVEVRGHDLLVHPKFGELAGPAKRFLVLQAIKTISFDLPIITQLLAGIHTSAQVLPFDQPALQAYQRAAIHDADLRAASASPEILHGGLNALASEKAESAIPDDGRPSLAARSARLYALFDSLHATPKPQLEHTYYGELKEDQR